MIHAPSALVAASDLVTRMLRSAGFQTSTASAMSGVVVELLRVLVVLLIAGVASRIGGKATIRLVRKLRRKSAESAFPERAAKRLQTLGHSAASALRVAIWATALFTVLGTLKINLAPLLAGATFLGAALGIGAQNIVRDVITGFFLIAEDQFGIGDSISIFEGLSGTVEDITLRVTRVRTLDGTVWYVPNGDIRKLGNSSIEWNRSVVDVEVNQGQDIKSVLSSVRDAVSAVYTRTDISPLFVGPPEVWGVDAMDADHATIRIVSKTIPGKGDEIARAMRESIGTALVTEGRLQAPQSQIGTPRSTEHPGK